MNKIDITIIENEYEFSFKTCKGNSRIIVKKDKDISVITIVADYLGAFGTGERFNCINQKGRTCVNQVVEKFCNQGDFTYLSIPFFLTDAGFGVFIDTKKVSQFDFKNEISIICPSDSMVYLFTGEPKEIIKEFNALLGGPISTPPKYAFGPWISANHWKSEKDVRRVREDLKKYDFPATVMVLEAWSDEATFYIFNGASYEPKKDGEAFKYEDFDFASSPYWNNPKKMIEELDEDGIKLVLWQIPVFKKMDEGEYHLQNDYDSKDAIASKTCVFTEDGEPYKIPEGNWFGGSLIPDFTNEETKKKWFGKRQYLLDIGVAGFKTDGGEFVYRDDLIFANGVTGKEQKNAYSQTYVDSYKEFIGNDRVLFSRAGYTGAQRTPFVWAGDHQSTNNELKHAYYSAISSANSGILYWSFDIGGFAGPLPTEDVYLRSTQFACFCPVMQWHSEPDGGQFKEIMPGADGNNERSPWNIAAVNNDEGFIDEIRYWHKLRMKLLPYIYSQAEVSAKTGIPMMRPVFWENTNDKELVNRTDEYFFGEDLLVSPLLEVNQAHKEVYLPKGKWVGFFSKEIYEGNQNVSSIKEKFPVFIRQGKEIF